MTEQSSERGEMEQESKLKSEREYAAVVRELIQRENEITKQDRITKNEDLVDDMPPIDGAFPTRFPKLQPRVFVPWAVIAAWLLFVGYLIVASTGDPA
jgi:hypothetical protein